MLRSDLSSKEAKAICVRKEYQSLFESNGFKLESEKEALPGEPTRKKIVRLELVGIVSPAVFGTTATNEHYAYGLQDFMEIVNKIVEFERDVREDVNYANTLSVVSRKEMIEECSSFFRPQTIQEYFRNHCHRNAMSAIHEASVEEILQDLIHTSRAPLADLVASKTGQERENSDISEYFSKVCEVGPGTKQQVLDQQ